MRNLTIKTSFYDFETFTTISVSIGAEEQKYNPLKDEKWIEFCKKHNFHPKKDYYYGEGKIFRLYLDLCANDLI